MQRSTPYDNLDYLSDLMLRSAQMGAKMALQEAGVIKHTVTLAEVKKLHGRAIAREVRMSDKVKWVPINKNNPGSQVYCLRSELEKYLFRREFDFTKK